MDQSEEAKACETCRHYYLGSAPAYNSYKNGTERCRLGFPISYSSCSQWESKFEYKIANRSW